MKNNKLSSHELTMLIIEREVLSGAECEFPVLVKEITSTDSCTLFKDAENFHDKDSIRTMNELFDIKPCPEMIRRLQREYLN